MPASTLTTFDDLSEQIGEAVHNFASHTFKLALAAAANAPVASNTILANITQIAATGGYTAGGYTLTGVGYTETSGTATLAITSPFTITATGGAVGPFRYLIIYNDTATSPADALVGWLDYGSDLTLADGESLAITSASGVLTVTS
jgi:hypothetical protein